MRKLVGIATLSIYISQVVDEAGVKTLTFEQTANIVIGGIKAETEIRVLDWREDMHTSVIFGTTTHRSKLIDPKNALDHEGNKLHSFLTEGILQESPDPATNVYDLVVQSATNGWTIQQLWGFGIVEGKRMYVRRTLVTKGNQEVKVRGVYEWKGKTKA